MFFTRGWINKQLCDLVDRTRFNKSFKNEGIYVWPASGHVLLTLDYVLNQLFKSKVNP
jgi:hypothetical protein